MSLRFVRLVFTLGGAVSLAHSVSSWGMDTALASVNKDAASSPICVILCSILASSGGGILANMLALLETWETKHGTKTVAATQSAIKSSALPLQRALIDSLVYYLLIDPHGLLSSAALPWVGGFAQRKDWARAFFSVYVLLNTLLDFVRPGSHLLSEPVTLVLALFNVKSVVSQTGEATAATATIVKDKKIK